MKHYKYNDSFYKTVYSYFDGASAEITLTRPFFDNWLNEDSLFECTGITYSPIIGYHFLSRVKSKEKVEYIVHLGNDSVIEISTIRSINPLSKRKITMNTKVTETEMTNTEVKLDHNGLSAGFAKILSIITEVDPDSARFGEYIYLTRAQYSLDTYGWRYEIQNRADITFELVSEFIRSHGKNYFSGVNYARTLELDPVLEIVDLYVVVERVHSSINIHMFGSPTRVQELHDELSVRYHVPKTIKVHDLMAFTTNGPVINTTELIETNQQLALDCFYPWMESSVEDYANAFMNSNSSVLILFGKPGLGKSTFLRSLMYFSKRPEVAICANSNAMLDPNIVSWIGSQGRDAFVVLEDADLLIKGDRQTDGNQMISSILNLADGIVKNGLKLVISTNLPSLKSLDPALMRAGRMFDALEFRPLTIDEANVVRTTMGKSEIELSTELVLTLAEAINYVNDADLEKRKVKRVGF